MAEPLRRTADIPNFDTYPAEAREPNATLGHPERQLSPGAMVAAAERVGRAAGVAVSTVRGLPDRLGAVKSRLVLVKERGAGSAVQTANEWAERAGARATELKENARRLARRQLRAAQDRLQVARARAQHIANEHPLQVIAGAAGVAFLLGLSLRIWRERRD
jgi:ElaB/YqjD/DUF883 family membrane-anchored ribosome-binding protein